MQNNTTTVEVVTNCVCASSLYGFLLLSCPSLNVSGCPGWWTCSSISATVLQADEVSINHCVSCSKTGIMFSLIPQL